MQVAGQLQSSIASLIQTHRLQNLFQNLMVSLPSRRDSEPHGQSGIETKKLIGRLAQPITRQAVHLVSLSKRSRAFWVSEYFLQTASYQSQIVNAFQCNFLGGGSPSPKQHQIESWQASMRLILVVDLCTNNKLGPAIILNIKKCVAMCMYMMCACVSRVCIHINTIHTLIHSIRDCIHIWVAKKRQQRLWSLTQRTKKEKVQKVPWVCSLLCWSVYARTERLPWGVWSSLPEPTDFHHLLQKGKNPCCVDDHCFGI